MPIGTKQEIAVELTQKSREILTGFHEKIVLYAAGSISLSTTLLGFLLSSHADALRNVYWLMPNIWYLFLSWASFVLALLAALYSRRWDADFLFSFGMRTLSDVELKSSATKNITALMETLSKRRTQTQALLDRLILLQRIAETAFPIGLILLLVFTIFNLLTILK